MKIKCLACAILTVSLSVAFLWHFSNIWLYGTHLIQEPSKGELISETIMLLAIFLFGFSVMISEAKEKR